MQDSPYGRKTRRTVTSEASATLAAIATFEQKRRRHLRACGLGSAHPRARAREMSRNWEAAQAFPVSTPQGAHVI